MPLYEYFCPPCNSQFELLRPVSKMDAPATCPDGHTTNNRVLSLFAPLARGESNVATMPIDMSQGGGDSCCGGSCSCC
jgi:putative FmdB family regulatory protein